jgi:hypothetical protein
MNARGRQMNSDLIFRLARIHDALGQARTPQSHYPTLLPKVYSDGNRRLWMQDFTGGHGDARLFNSLQHAIASVAGIQDILLEHFAHSPSASEKIQHCFRTAPSLDVLRELWNADKHGRFGRKGEPRNCWIENVQKVLRLRTSERAGSSMSLGFSQNGSPVVFGDGSSDVVVTGDICYRNTSRRDDAYEKIMCGIDEVYALLTLLGVLKQN